MRRHYCCAIHNNSRFISRTKGLVERDSIRPVAFDGNEFGDRGAVVKVKG
jgi:hypothetical protein